MLLSPAQGQGGCCWLLLSGQLCSVVSSRHLQNKHCLSVSSCHGQLQRAQAGGRMSSITGWCTCCFRAVECDGIRNCSENIMSRAAAVLGVGWQSQGWMLCLQSSPVSVGWRKASGCCSPGGHWRLHPAPSSSRGHQQQGCEPAPSPLQWARVWGREHLHWQAHTWDLL